MRAVILSLLLLSVPASAIQSRSITIAQDTDTDSRCFAAYLKQPIPDFEIDEEDAISFDLKNYYAAGDDNVTNSPKCTDVAPTIVAGGNAVTGLALNTTDLDNATYGGTTTTSSAGTGTLTLTFDNSISTSVVDSIGWTVNDSGTPAVDPPMPATAYCVSSVGNDSASGRFPNCWRTMGKVNGFTFSAGDDVYLRAGDVFGNQTLTVDWGGISSNRAVVGAYYVSSGQAFIGLNGANRPELNGTYDSGCRPSSCAFNASGAIPASQFGAIIQVAAVDYVTVQDITIRDSAGRGIAWDGGNVATGLLAKNLLIEYALSSGVTMEKAFRGNFTGNTLRYISYSSEHGYTTNWAPCILASSNQQGVKGQHLIQNNTLENCAGEGIDLVRTAHNIVRGNELSNVRRPALYIDNSSDNILEHNLVNGDGSTYGRTFLTCLAVSVEPYGNNLSNTRNSVRNLIRNNVCGNTGSFIYVNVQTGSPFNGFGNPAAAGYQVGARFYGNTANTSGGIEVNNNLTTNNNVDFIDIQNNIAQGSASCSSPTSVSTSLINFNDNLFPSTPSNSRCDDGAIVGSADLSDAAALANSSTSAKFALADAALGASSAADEVGTSLVSTILTVGDYPQKADFVAGSHNSCLPSDSDWAKALAYDFSCTARGTPPDLGALED